MRETRKSRKPTGDSAGLVSAFFQKSHGPRIKSHFPLHTTSFRTRNTLPAHPPYLSLPADEHKMMGHISFPTLNLVGDQLDAWSKIPLHPTLLPFGVLVCIHAARVSHAARQVAGSHKYRLSVWQGFLLNQILMFSGVILSGFLLGIPSPLLTAWPVIALYGGMHVLLDLTPLGKLLLQAQDIPSIGQLMDLFFAILDGTLRAEGIIDLGILPVRNHPNKEISNSIFAAILNAAIIGGAVPLFIDLFKLDSATGEWGVRTPKWAKDLRKDTNDLVSAGLTGLVYLVLVEPKRFPLFADVVKVVGLDVLSEREVRVLCAELLGSWLLAEKALALSKQSKLLQGGNPKAITNTRPIAAAAANGSSKSPRKGSRKQQ